MNKVEYKDIYFDPKYGKAYEEKEKGLINVFEYENEYGKICNIFLKRKILFEGEEDLYDIVTPYGYGGPSIEFYDENNKGNLVEEYYQEFEKYCNENKIVSEFVRYHPIEKNHIYFTKFYDVKNLGQTVGTNLKGENVYENEFSKSARKTIRQCLNKGITYEVIHKPNEVEDFKKIYYSTMDRNNAKEYYYFNDEYFKYFLDNFNENILYIKILYENKVIAAAFYFVFNKTIHAHLSGTLTEYLKLSPAYITKYATLKWGIENGYELVHYGGGDKSDKDNPLFKFKTKFTKETIFDFYIGQKIWNEEKYKFLEKKLGKKEKGFFPSYRR